MSVGRERHNSKYMLADEFEKRGYTIEGGMLGGRLTMRYTSPAGKSFMTFGKHISYPLSNSFVQKVSSNKLLAYEFADSLGISTPALLMTDTLNDEARAFLATHKRLIAKPVSAWASRGLTLDIRDEATLERAITAATHHDGQAILQRQVDGAEVRIVVLGGTAVGAYERQKPRLIGDGVSTVRQLFEAENAERARITWSFGAYVPLPEALLGELDQSSVPSKGEIMVLSPATTLEKGASLVNVSSVLHRSYKECAERYARSIGSDFIVVDFLIADMTAPAGDDNYWFLETNMAPELRFFFYSERYDNALDIVPMIVETIDKRIHL